MDITKLITNPYVEKIYDSFRGTFSDEEYSRLIEECIKSKLGNNEFDVLKLECGVGLSLLLRLSDQSKVYVKIVKGLQLFEHQNACCEIQKYLYLNGFPCTVPIGLPVKFLDCSLHLEEFNETGEYRDSHDTGVMRLQAEALARLHWLLERYSPEKASLVAEKTMPQDQVWYNPPQDVFSFDMHKTGDEWLKEKAVAAKKIFENDADRKKILSHEDWSNKHFRFNNDEITVIYDWDSITRIDELYTIGLACIAFTATWYYPTKIFPSQEEAAKFVELYSNANGKKYSKAEREIISAYAAYTITYIARCAYAYNNGTLTGHDIEQPFNEIQNGMYF